jgi:hypothetical protein
LKASSLENSLDDDEVAEALMKVPVEMAEEAIERVSSARVDCGV